MKLSSDDLPFLFEPHHAEVEARVRGFCRGWEDSGGGDAERTRRAVAALADAGLLEYCVPPSEARLDVRSLTLVREGLGQVDGLLDFAFAMQGLGSCPIRLVGTPEQRARYLPGIARGERIGAFALTEPDAGSDVSSLSCRATQDGSGWRLDGEKTFISNAGVASQYVVFANADPAAGRRGISAFLVEPDDRGLSVEPFEVIAPHPIGTLRFDGCRVPGGRLLGEVGGGFRLAMQTLDRFRNTVAGAALGMARRALDEALDFAVGRVQFGRPLIEHQQVAAYLADSATELDAARLLVYRAAHAKDTREERVSLEVAMGKLYATEAAQRIIDRAVQIHGGRGVRKGEVVERLYREIRALRIYEGTSEIQRVVIAAGLREASGR